jgi:hypothetical protein
MGLNSLARRSALIYNGPVSVLLKFLFLLRLRCRRTLGIFLRRPLAAAPRLSARGQEAPLPFLEGVNLPWLRYGGDFGASAWSPDGGIGRPARQEELRRHLRELRGRGNLVVRWFLLCDGRAGIRFNKAGTPLGPDDRLFSDIDAALEAAADAGVKLIFVLLDFLWFSQAVRRNGVQVGGHTAAIDRPYKQRLLRRRLLRPLLERYGRSPAILAWDIINEPEWATRGWGGESGGGAVSFTAMRRFIKRVTRLIHRHTAHLATVGLANAAGLPLVGGCGLDVYQVHWYDRWESVASLDWPVLAMGLDRPLLLGEFPTKNSSRPSEAIAASARRSGYCGALAWSALATDRSSGIDLESERLPG